ncbi:MAG TPA: hypothetical protein VGW38_08340 [Chloroflexota bacterium]|nr:hypothetical protein [Chloroflexota bacterium]
MAQAREGHSDRWGRTTRVRLWGSAPVAPAILIFLGTGIVVLLALAAGAVIATAPVRPVALANPATQTGFPPAEEAVGLWWFTDRAPVGEAPGPGLWRRERAGDAWAWSPLPAQLITDRPTSDSGQLVAPPWPADPTRVSAIRIADSSGKLVGFWVWNPAAFEVIPSGTHQWRPRWEWTPAGTPLMLLGEGRS